MSNMLNCIPTRRCNKLKKKAVCKPHPEAPQEEEDFHDEEAEEGGEEVEGKIVQEPTEPSTYSVVICGATNPGRGPIFGDFITICHALMGRGVYGDFISCFPIDDHFDWLQRQKSKDHGGDKTTTVSAANVYGGCLTYTKEEYDTCQKWWHQSGPFEIEGKIRQWMQVKAKRAIPGDVINVVVCGHADPQRLGFYAGYHRIFPFEIDRMLGKFKPGVTVNFISGSAHSVEEEGCELRTAPTKRPKPHCEEFHGLA